MSIESKFKTSLRKLFVNIGVIFFACILLLVVSEFLFRVFKGKELYLKITTGIEGADSPYCHKPNYIERLTSSKEGEFDVMVRINNFGFRGKDMELEKKEGVLRIFAVGDSFTYGVGARQDETIPYLLEKKLLRQEFPVEVINAGVGHNSPLSHYLNLRDKYLRYKPDLVLLFFDFSDLWDDWHMERGAVRGKQGEILYIDPYCINGKKDWWELLTKNSEFLRYINNKIVRTIKKIKVLGISNYMKAKLKGERAKAVISNLDEEDSNIDTIEYDQYLLIRGRDKLPQIKKHWPRTEKYLLKIRDLLKENNIDLIIVIYPYGIHVSGSQWAEGRTYWGFEEGKVYDDYYAFDLLEDFSRRNGIICVNTLDDFLKDKETPMFFDLDGHLNPRGNEVLARSIVRNKIFRGILESKGLY